MTIEQSDGACTPSFSSAELEGFEAWWAKHGQFCRAGGGEYEKTFAFRAWQAATTAERDRICAAIKAEDDHCADGDYMMDSDDCIKVVRGTWKRPDWNGSNAK